MSAVRGDDLTLQRVGDDISGIVLRRAVPPIWLVGMGFTTLLVFGFFYAIDRTIFVGVGLWGINIPIAWGFAITNFVWWVGIGHAGTLISAFLLLMHQEWRTSINRFAEAMTLFAVACAGLMPLLHLGRPWVFYFLVPYPNTMGLWPQFRSPLVWDVFAVSTYLTVSLLFWYLGLLPDLATMRDSATHPAVKRIYGLFALGWRGASAHWKRYKLAYFILAGLATPLVLSVHSVVSLDFAVAIVPGWHTSIFPPYFVAGAIFSGFAMVVNIAVPLRSIYKLESYLTLRHFENCAKLMLVTGMIVSYGYGLEVFMAWYSGDIYEHYAAINRALGPYAPTYWAIIFCNVLTPQILWWRQIRINPWALFVVSLIIQFGMWTERYVIIIVSLTRDFMPSAWGTYHGTLTDWAILIGSIGFFLWCFLLFIRFVPMISMSEMREDLTKGSKHR